MGGHESPLGLPCNFSPLSMVEEVLGGIVDVVGALEVALVMILDDVERVSNVDSGC